MRTSTTRPAESGPQGSAQLRRGALLWLAAMLLWSSLTTVATAMSEIGRCPDTLDLPGVTKIGEIPLDRVGGLEQFVLTVHIYRLRRAPVPSPDPQRAGQENRYIDFLLAYHQPEERLAPQLAPWLEQLQSLGRVESEFRCTMQDDANLQLFAPFVTTDGEQIQLSRQVIGLVREVSGVLQASAFAEFVMPVLPSDEIGALLEDLGLEPGDGGTPVQPGTDGADLPPDTGPRRNYYAWIPDLDFSPPEPGEAVFALDRLECADDGNFLVGSLGDIAADPAQPLAGRQAVVRRSMIASNVYYGVSGRPDDAATVNASVDESAYWCIPKREFCYQQIDFGDFAVPAHAGEIKEYEATRVVSLRHGLVQALQRLIMDRCPQSAIEQGVR